MHADTLHLQIQQHLPAAQRGDTAAFGRIVAGCQSTVTSIALAIVRDVPTSEDIAQDAFLSAWSNLRRLKNPASFLPWLRQITRNLARDHLRTRHGAAQPVDDLDALLDRVADPAPCPAQQQLADEQAALAADVIDALPDDSREVLLLFYREGQSSQQVAALLGLSDAAVRKRLSRARQAVREDLLARLGELARSTAPGAAFTAVVTAALSLASPAASAAGVLAAGAAGTAGKGIAQLLLGSLGGVAIGLGGAFIGIVWGLRRQLRDALDQRERVALTRSAIINGTASVLFVLGILASAAWTDGWLAPALVSLLFFAVVLHQSMVAQPRAMARRHALEAQRDPVAAERRRARERLTGWAGVLLGLVLGGGGLVYGLIASGRL